MATVGTIPKKKSTALPTFDAIRAQIDTLDPDQLLFFRDNIDSAITPDIDQYLPDEVRALHNQSRIYADAKLKLQGRIPSTPEGVQRDPVQDMKVAQINAAQVKQKFDTFPPDALAKLDPVQRNAFEQARRQNEAILRLPTGEEFPGGLLPPPPTGAFGIPGFGPQAMDPYARPETTIERKLAPFASAGAGMASSIASVGEAIAKNVPLPEQLEQFRTPVTGMFQGSAEQLQQLAEHNVPEGGQSLDEKLIGGFASMGQFAGAGMVLAPLFRGAAGAAQAMPALQRAANFLVKAGSKSPKLAQYITKTGITPNSIIESGVQVLGMGGTEALVETGDVYSTWLRENPGDEAGAIRAAGRTFGMNMALIPTTEMVGSVYSPFFKGWGRVKMSIFMEGAQEGGQYAIQQNNLNKEINWKDFWENALIGGVVGGGVSVLGEVGNYLNDRGTQLPQNLVVPPPVAPPVVPPPPVAPPVTPTPTPPGAPPVVTPPGVTPPWILPTPPGTPPTTPPAGGQPGEPGPVVEPTPPEVQPGPGEGPTPIHEMPLTGILDELRKRYGEVADTPEYEKAVADIKDHHRKKVIEAKDGGLLIPQSVQDEYPDIFPKALPPAPPEEGGEETGGKPVTPPTPPIQPTPPTPVPTEGTVEGGTSVPAEEPPVITPPSVVVPKGLEDIFGPSEGESKKEPEPEKPTEIKPEPPRVEPAPARTFKIGRGKKGLVTVIFPDKAHADLYAHPGRLDRGKTPETQHIEKRFGIKSEEVLDSGKNYKTFVHDFIKDHAEGDTIEVPSYDEYLASRPKPAEPVVEAPVKEEPKVEPPPEAVPPPAIFKDEIDLLNDRYAEADNMPEGPEKDKVIEELDRQLSDLGLKSGLEAPTVTNVPDTKPHDKDPIHEPGKLPIEVNVDPDTVGFKPDVFQFKEHGDARGVVDPIKGEYEDRFGGIIMAYEYANGERFVANGHHRLDLAQRTNEARRKEGKPGVTVVVQVVKETDGYTPADARRMAAEVNIVGGRGTVIDHAQFFRNQPEYTEIVAGKRGVAGQGYTIARLAKSSLYDEFASGKIEADRTSAILEAAGEDEDLQFLGLKRFHDNPEITPQSLTNFINAVKAAPPAQSTGPKQRGLFGGEEWEDLKRRADAMAERATKIQKEIRDRKNAIAGTIQSTSRVKKAGEMGVKVEDIEKARENLERIRILDDRFTRWSQHQDLVDQINRVDASPAQIVDDLLGAIKPKPPSKAPGLFESKKKEEPAPPKVYNEPKGQKKGPDESGQLPELGGVRPERKLLPGDHGPTEANRPTTDQGPVRDVSGKPDRTVDRGLPEGTRSGKGIPESTPEPGKPVGTVPGPGVGSGDLGLHPGESERQPGGKNVGRTERDQVPSESNQERRAETAPTGIEPGRVGGEHPAGQGPGLVEAAPTGIPTDDAIEKMIRQAKEKAAGPTPSEKLKEAGSQIVGGIKSGLQGLDDLFGGGPGTLKSFPGVVDEETYRKARPHFNKMYRQFRAAGRNIYESIADVIDLVIKKWGDNIDAYVLRWAHFIRNAEERRAKPAEKEGEFQIEYKAHSRGPSLSTLIPVRMQESVTAALDKLEDGVGDIDQFVADELKFPSVESMWEVLGAEQIDAGALAISNLNKKSGFIIGDQTGVGKGRFVAAMIKWGLLKGHVPVFVTRDAALYEDMIRDLHAIGVPLDVLGEAGGYKILPTNNKFGETNTIPLDAVKSGAELRVIQPGLLTAALADMAAGRKSKFDIVFTTYYQMQYLGEQATPRHRALSGIADKSLIVLDESHEAGGSGVIEVDHITGEPVPSRANFVRSIISKAKGAIYSSATWAKRPNVMSLYASTDLGLLQSLGVNIEELMGRGGIPMQQVVANMLVRANQFLRREKSFSGIDMGLEEVEVHHPDAEESSASVRDIFAFDQALNAVRRDYLPDLIRASGGAIVNNPKLGRPKMTYTPFSAVMHNIVQQMLLSIKAQQAADRAIAVWNEGKPDGKKPIITLSNTMGAFLNNFTKEMGIDIGENLADFNFNSLLERYLNRTPRVRITDSIGEKHEVMITDEMLAEKHPHLLVQKDRALESIRSKEFQDISVSPIDVIVQQMEAAGMKVGEITGRNAKVIFKEDGSAVLEARKTGPGEKKRAMNAFNDGGLDALLLNRSGSTGFSLHSDKGYKDQRARHMIVVQSEPNVDTFVQILGRSNRTNQVNLPSYEILTSDLPAEKRGANVLLKKMASLNANTTANRASNFTLKQVTDFFNRYGDAVVATYLRNEPQGLARQLGVDPSKPEDIALTVTGRLAILPIAVQEQFYNAVEEAYKEHIEHLDATGQNALEAKVLELDAVHVASEPLTRRMGESPFQEASNVETLDVRRAGKPLNRDQIHDLLEKNILTALGKPLDTKLDVDELQTLGEEATDKILGKLRDKYSEMIAGKRAEKQGKTPAQQLQIDTQIRSMNLARDKVNAFFQNFSIGTTVKISERLLNEAGKFDLGEQNDGIIVNVRGRKDAANPMTMGNVVVTIAVNAPGNPIPFTLSTLDHHSLLAQGAQADAARTHSIVDTNRDMSAQMDEFEANQHERREKRLMVTGNLVMGFHAVRNRGQITFYVDENGDTHQGILMPRGMTIEQAGQFAPFNLNDADHVIRFIDAVGKDPWIVRTQESAAIGPLTITKTSKDTVVLKTENPQYWGLKAVTDITGVFVKPKHGNEYYLFFSNDPGHALLKRALDTYQKELGSVFTTTTNKKVAEATLPRSNEAGFTTIHQDLAAAIDHGIQLIRDGITDFFRWSRAMIKKFGDWIKPELRGMYARLKDERGAIGDRTTPAPVNVRIDKAVRDAQKFEGWKDWYERHGRIINELFGIHDKSDIELFKKILAATSAHTSVAANVDIALSEFFYYKKRGKFKTKFEAHRQNLDRILDDIRMHGPKISEMEKAMMGDPDAIVVDTHMIRYYYADVRPTLAMIEGIKVAVRRAAKELGWTNRQTQAAIWAASIVQQGSNREELTDYAELLQKHAGEIRTFLERLRDTGVAGRSSRGLRAGGPTAEATPEGSALETPTEVNPHLTVSAGVPPASIRTLRPLHEIRAAFDNIVSRWPAALRLSTHWVDTFDDLPQPIRDSFRTGPYSSDTKNIKGVHSAGQAYVIGSLSKNVDDLEVTLYHETYGHLGLHELYGADVRAKMTALAEAIGEKKLNELATKYGVVIGQYGQALQGGPTPTVNSILTEELIAHIAGLTKEPTWRQRAKEIMGGIREWLREIGFMRLPRFNDMDLAVILRDARRAARGEIKSDRVLKVQLRNPQGQFQSAVQVNPWQGIDAEIKDIMERHGLVPPTQPPPIKFKDGFGVIDEGLKATLLREIQDDLYRLKMTQQAIEKTRRRPIAASADAYAEATVWMGRAEEKLKAFKREFIRPLEATVRETGLAWNDIHLFLYAKHAPERNERIAKINPKMPDGGSGMTNLEAETVLTDFDQRGMTADLERVAAIVWNINKERVRILREAGLENNEVLDAWEEYESYVPLRGTDDQFEEGEPEAPRVGRRFDIRGNESRRALGRYSRAADMIPYSIMQVEESIIRAEKSKVGRAFLELVKENPNPDFWEIDKVVYHARWDERKQEVVYGPDPKHKWADNVFVVKEEGKHFLITIKDKNNLLPRAMKNLGADNSRTIIELMSAVNRYYAKINTTLSPLFTLGNLSRDTWTAFINMAGEQSSKQAFASLSQVPKAMKGIYRVERDHAATGYWEDRYKQFKEAGGKVAFLQLENISRKREDLMKMMEVAQGNKWALTKDQVGKVFDFIGDVNSIFENGTRLTAFDRMLQDGHSERDAAVYAKNITVNFNRKGEQGHIISAFWLFGNAGIQGVYRLRQAMSKPGVQKIAAIIIATSFAISELNRFMGGKDDDDEWAWNKYTDYERERNLMILAPGGKVAFKMPLPYGYNVFHSIGFSISNLIHGEDLAKETARLGSSIYDSFNPLGGGTIMQTIMPTIVDPWYELGTNANFFGAKIRPDQPAFGAKKPPSELYWPSVNPVSREVAAKINELTGGTAAIPGAISISPEDIDHIVRNLVGGLGSSMAMVTEMIGRAASGYPEDIKARRVPFLRTFVSTPAENVDSIKYRETLEELRQLTAEGKRLREENDVQGLREFNAKNLRLAMLARRGEIMERHFADMRRKIGQINNSSQPYADKRNQEQAIRNQMEQMQSQFNAEIKRARP